MTVLGFVVLLVIAAIAGAIGQSLAGYSLGGCVVSTIVGFIGAYIGTWLANTFNLPAFIVLNIDGRPFPIVWAIIGSTLLALILGLLSRRRYA